MSENDEKHLQEHTKHDDKIKSNEIQDMQNKIKPFLGASTLGLMDDLKASDDFDEFTEKHRTEFISSPLSEYIQQIIHRKSLKRADVIRKANLDRVFGFQIINGQRIPSREKLIQMGYGLALNTIEINSLLKFAGYLPLFAKDIRDAAIIFCLNNGYNLLQTQEMLEEYGLKPIGDK